MSRDLHGLWVACVNIEQLAERDFAESRFLCKHQSRGNYVFLVFEASDRRTIFMKLLGPHGEQTRTTLVLTTAEVPRDVLQALRNGAANVL